MIELAKNQTIMFLDALDETCKPWNEAVVINAERIGVRTRLLRHHHRFGHDHGHTTARALGVVGPVTMRRQPVGGAVVGPHRSHDDTVLQAKIADASRLLKQHGYPPVRAGEPLSPLPVTGNHYEFLN